MWIFHKTSSKKSFEWKEIMWPKTVISKKKFSCNFYLTTSRVNEEESRRTKENNTRGKTNVKMLRRKSKCIKSAKVTHYILFSLFMQRNLIHEIYLHDHWLFMHYLVKKEWTHGTFPRTSNIYLYFLLNILRFFFHTFVVHSIVFFFLRPSHLFSYKILFTKQKCKIFILRTLIDHLIVHFYCI